MKKGVSPLLASVILIGVVIVFASFMFYSISGFSERTIGSTEDVIESARLIDFKVKLLSPSPPCADASEHVGDEDNCYVILIENQMGEEISYIVRTVGETGVDLAGETGMFSPFVSKTVAVHFDSEKTGEDGISAEVVPISY